MKCPQCAHQHRSRDGAACSKCGYVFVYAPRMDHMSDARMKALVHRTSGGERYPYTAAHLQAQHALLARRQSLLSVRLAFGTLCVVSGALGLGAWSHALTQGFASDNTILAVGATLSFVALALMWALSTPGKSTSQRFAEHLRRWRARHELAGLLHGGERRLTSAPQAAPEPDLYDYGVERVLVVGQPLWVDLLVLGGFHAAQRCLVVSAQGYPEYLRPTLERVLREQPQVPLFGLRDVRESGDALRAQLEALVGPQHAQRMMDVSLNPGEVWAYAPLRQAKALLVQTKQPESLMLLAPATLHALLERALAHRVTLGELLRGQRDEDSQGSSSSLVMIEDFG